MQRLLYSKSLIKLFFRLLYSPISIREEIDDLIENPDKVRKKKFRYRTILIQIFLIAIISVIIILCLYILYRVFKSHEFYQYIVNYLIGAVIGLFSILFFTWFFFRISNKDLLNLSFFRAFTRLWLFTIGGGLLLLLFYLVRNANDYEYLLAIYFISFTFGFITQKAYQLMSITNAMDNDIFDNKMRVLKENKNYKNQVASMILLIILNIIIIVSGGLLENSNLYFYLKFSFGITLSLGFITGIYSYPFGYFLIVKPIFFIFKKEISYKNKLEILVYDEILGRKSSYHKSLLDKAFEDDEKYYYRILEKYLENNPYTEGILKHLIQNINNKNYDEILFNYLNSTDEINIINNLENNINEKYIEKLFNKKKKALQAFNEIIELNSLIQEKRNFLSFFFMDKRFDFDFFNTIKNFIGEPLSVFDFREELSERKDDIIKKNKIYNNSYLHNLIIKIFDEYIKYISDKVQDTENPEISITLIENYLTFYKNKGYLTIQLINNTKYKIDIGNIRINTNKPKLIKIIPPKFKKYLNTSEIYQFHVEFFISKNTPFSINIHVLYKTIKQERKLKRLKKELSTIDISKFKPIKPNPFTVRPVTKTEMFFGRKEIIESIIQNLENKDYPSIITIYGERRFGKSSLLKHLLNLNISQFKTFYLDSVFLNMENNQIEYLLAKLLSLINIKNDFKTNKVSIDNFINHISEKKYLFLIDEFDLCFNITGLYKFIHSVRNIQKGFKPVFIFTFPRYTTKKLSTELKFLFNSEKVYSLNIFNLNDSYKLITEPLKNNVVFTPAAIDLIYSYTGGFPIYIQSLCSELVFNINKTKQSLITTDFIEKLISESPEDFASLMNPYLGTISNEKLQILISLKNNNNRIEINQAEREILTSTNSFFNVNEVIDKLKELNIVDFEENYLHCTSKFLLSEINKI